MAATITATATRITISGTYKAFTSTTGSTTTVINYNTGDAPAAGDAGRFLMWKNTVGATGTWEIRYIVSATTTTVTVGDGGFSSAPGSGESFVISTNLADIKTAVTASVTVNGNQYSFGARDWNLTSAAFLADVDKSLYMVPAFGANTDVKWPIADSCAVQFGRLNGGEANNSTETTRGCHLTFAKTGNFNGHVYSSTNTRSNTGPVINYYGCLVESTVPSPADYLFQRMLGPTRFIGCVFDGPMGGRFYHEASEWVACRMSGNDSQFPAWSIGATFTRSIDDIVFYDGLAAMKNYQTFGGVVRNTTFASSLISVFYVNGSTGSVFDFIDCTTFTDAQINDNDPVTSLGVINQYKSINYTVADTAGSALSGVLVACYDTAGTLQSTIKTSVAGVVPEILTKFFIWTDNSPSVTKSPFTIRTRKYGYVYQDINSTVSDPIKQQNRLATNSVTVLSESAAAALTGIAINFTSKTVTVTASHTMSEIYDYCQSQLALSANMNRTEFIKTTDGNVFTFETNWDLILGANGDITSAAGKIVVFSGTGDLKLNDAGNTIDGLTINGPLNLGAGISTLTDLTISTTTNFSISGTYTLNRCNLNVVTNSSGGTVVLEIDSNTAITTNTGPNITINAPTGSILFTELVASSQVVVFETGTQTEVFRTNSSGTSENVTPLTAGTYDYTVMKAGYTPIRVTGIVITDTLVSALINQVEDRAYVASSGLTYGTTASLSGTEFDVTVPTTVQNWYSFWIEAWITEGDLTNTKFPIVTFGSQSFTLRYDYEFSAGSIQYLSRDGFRYVSTNGDVTTKYCAILSSGVLTGSQAEYYFVISDGVIDAQNTGNVDQVIKFFGDATHGDFDYSAYLDFKVQTNGYREAIFSVTGTYGTLEETLYVISLPQIAIDITTGNPSISGVTVTDNSASPISWDAGNGTKDYSITITDANSNSAENILRWLNYNLSLDATFEGYDPFQWPEMVLKNGSSYETIMGELHLVGGDVDCGVRVIDGSGNPHPGFTRFQSDDGTYGIPPTYNNLNITNIEDGSRLWIYNATTDTEMFNAIISGTTYSDTYTEGVEYTNGDVINIRVTYQSGVTAKLCYFTTAIAGAAGWSASVSQVDDEVYNFNAIDGSLVTGFVADYAETEIDVTVASDFYATNMYAWVIYNLTTEDGIRSFCNAVTALDTANIRINVASANAYIDNTTATNIKQLDNIRIFRSDGAYPVKSSGGGGIDIVWRDKVYIAETGVSGLTPAESAQLNLIATVDSNLEIINNGVKKASKLIPHNTNIV